MTNSAPSPPMPESSPFRPEGRPRSRLVALLIFLGVLAAAVLVIRYFGRAEAPAEAAAGHNHGTAPVSDSARAVMLSTEAAHRIGVTYAPVNRGPLGRVVRTVGIVGYDETRLSSVTARVDGWIERLYVNFEGQAVQTGEPLFTLYSPMLVAAQQELLLAARLSAELPGGTPDAVRAAGELVESARRRLLYWEVPPDEVRRVETTREIRKALTFRAPVRGVVIEKSVIAGQQVMAGQTLYRIADLRSVWLDGEIFERDLPSVRLGMPVVAEFPALPGAPRTGRITYIYPTLNVETRTARVRVELPNPRLELKPGMYATFRFAANSEPVLSVPRSAILATGKRNLVFVRLPDGALSPRAVEIGIATDDRIEILSGLALGDTVVASATFLVDAESNLASLLGGMGNMPGMDVSPAPLSGPGKPSGSPPAVRAPRDTMKMNPPAGEHDHGVPPGPAGV